MKKISLITAVLLTTLFTSCRKDYTCTCTEVINGTPTIVGSSTLRDTEKNVRSQCAQMASSDFNGSGANVTCKLN